MPSWLNPVPFAGMPSPLPSDLETVFRINDTALQRLQTLSFFVLVLLVSAVAFWALWNALQRDFQKLPRLSFLKSLGVVLLWGILFIVVLTMISGARELMTPGAWIKQGFTYRLAPDTRPEQSSSAASRRKHLESLRQALWQFAATHDGQFPPQAGGDTLSRELWDVPETGGLRYLYVAGRKATDQAIILAYEPEIDSEQRLVLLANGDIVRMRSAEIVLLLNSESQR